MPRSSVTTIITASEAKAKFSELLDRAQGGESFSITLHGEEAARLVPAKGPSRADIREAIARIKDSRSVLNPVGKSKLRLKELISEGRY